MIHDALTFPFRGVGKYMLIIGGVLSLVLSVAALFPFLGIVIAIGASGYFAAYYFDIVNSTASGKDEACDWPEFRDFWSDLVGPWLCWLSSFVFSFAPLFAVLFFFEPPGVIHVALLIVGFAHLPMALLSVAIFKTMRAAFWLNTIPAVMRCLPQYAVLVVILGFLTIANALVDRVLSAVPVAGWFLGFFLGMYALMVSARLIGLFYRENGEIFNVPT
jgi:hypothetical protein